MNTTPENAGYAVEQTVDRMVASIGTEVKSRSYRVANELQNKLNLVLRGQRHGRRYNIPGTGRMHYVRKDYTEVQYNRENMTARLIKRKKGTAFITYRKYTASAPGEPPAVRTGAFRASWHRKVYFKDESGHDFTAHGVTESRLKVGGKYLLGDLLDNGTSRMAARPYKQRVIEKSLPKVRRIYREPYNP